MARWRVENAIRFIKQSYRLEDIRLLDYTRLKNMMAVVLAAAFFAAVWLGESAGGTSLCETSRASRSASSAFPTSTTTRSRTASRGSSTDAADGAASEPNAEPTKCSRNCPCSLQAEKLG